MEHVESREPAFTSEGGQMPFLEQEPPAAVQFADTVVPWFVAHTWLQSVVGACDWNSGNSGIWRASSKNW